MRGKPGYLLQVKNGKTDKAISYHSEQKKEFGDRLLIHYVDDDLKPTEEKPVLKTIYDLKIIGFID